MRIMNALDGNDGRRSHVWEQVVRRAKWRSEMGAYLILSQQVKHADKIGLNLHLHAITQLVDGYQKEQGWCGACLDMGLMQLVSRMDGINQIASRYPNVVHQYKGVQQKAQKEGAEPRTKFVQTWKGHFRKSLLDDFMNQFCRGRW